MAGAEGKLRILAEEVTCSFCLEYFTEPVSVQCGHTFCTPCITRYWKGLKGGQKGTYPCPECRQRAPTNTLRPNRQLASIVQILAQRAPAAPITVGLLGDGHTRCTEHDEKLQLFCWEDKIPICGICGVSKGHRSHAVIPIGQAAHRFKAKFQSYLVNIKRKLENINELRTEEETKLTDLEGNFKIQRERITTAFKQVQQYLEKEMYCQLNNLEVRKKSTLQKIRGKVSELDKQQASTRKHIAVIEAKCQLPDLQLLQDMKIILSSFEKMKCQQPDSGHCKEIKKETAEEEKDEEEEEEKMEEEDQKEGEEEDQKEGAEEDKKEGEEEGVIEAEEEVEEEEEEEMEDDREEQEDVEDLQLKIIESLEWRWARTYAGEVSLDPGTAHRRLILSEDRRTVSLGNIEQELPDTPERFNPIINVLGGERLSSGRIYWEVEVGDSEWDLGVCDESVSRKGAITLSPEDGYWVVWLRDGEYKACTSAMTSLTPRVPPRVVGVFLDCEAGRLSVYNVTDRSHLFTFSEASFPHTLRPFFCPGTNEYGKNGGPLRVLPVTGGV